MARKKKQSNLDQLKALIVDLVIEGNQDLDPICNGDDMETLSKQLAEEVKFIEQVRNATCYEGVVTTMKTRWDEEFIIDLIGNIIDREQ